MRNNLFTFGDMWWLQNKGTTMGTPCACIYATLFFAYFEQTYILPTYKNNILFYVRTIDDILIIWQNTNDTTFEIFKNDLDNQCKLTWNTEEPTTQTNFLDLTITIDPQGNISTKTFQKPMNLFLYIPNHSEHPSNMTKSLIYGLLQTYMNQNTYHQDFISNAAKLYKRLIARGHQHSTLKTLFSDAADRLSIPKATQHNHTHTNSYAYKMQLALKQQEQVFFHIPYHPRDISRVRLRTIYQHIMENATPKTCDIRYYKNKKYSMRVKKLTIAYSRGKNLFDILCSSTLREHNNKVSDILHQLRA